LQRPPTIPPPHLRVLWKLWPQQSSGTLAHCPEGIQPHLPPPVTVAGHFAVPWTFPEQHSEAPLVVQLPSGMHPHRDPAPQNPKLSQIFSGGTPCSNICSTLVQDLVTMVSHTAWTPAGSFEHIVGAIDPQPEEALSSIFWTVLWQALHSSIPHLRVACPAPEQHRE